MYIHIVLSTIHLQKNYKTNAKLAVLLPFKTIATKGVKFYASCGMTLYFDTCRDIVTCYIIFPCIFCQLKGWHERFKWNKI